VSLLVLALNFPSISNTSSSLLQEKAFLRLLSILFRISTSYCHVTVAAALLLHLLPLPPKSCGLRRPVYMLCTVRSLCHLVHLVCVLLIHLYSPRTLSADGVGAEARSANVVAIDPLLEDLDIGTAPETEDERAPERRTSTAHFGNIAIPDVPLDDVEMGAAGSSSERPDVSHFGNVLIGDISLDSVDILRVTEEEAPIRFQFP
jgi:hypothetical protein